MNTIKLNTIGLPTITLPTVGMNRIGVSDSDDNIYVYKTADGMILGTVGKEAYQLMKESV